MEEQHYGRKQGSYKSWTIYSFAHVFIANTTYLELDTCQLDMGWMVETEGKKVRPETVLAAYQRMEKELT